MTRLLGLGLFVAVFAAAAAGHAIGMRKGEHIPDLVEAVDWLQSRR